MIYSDTVKIEYHRKVGDKELYIYPNGNGYVLQEITWKDDKPISGRYVTADSSLSKLSIKCEKMIEEYKDKHE